MRPFHLLELQNIPPLEGVLVLSPVVKPSHHALVLAFTRINAGVPVLEVDWYEGFSGPNRRLIDHFRLHRGFAGTLLSVRVRSAVDLDPVIHAPEVTSFRHAVVQAPEVNRGASFALLARIAKAVEVEIGRRYTAFAVEHKLDVGAWRAVRSFTDTLLDPVEVVDVANALVELQWEGVRPEQRSTFVVRRALASMLRDRAPEQVTTLMRVAAGLSVEDDEALQAMKEQLLVLDGQPHGWARWLADREVVTGLFGSEGILELGRDKALIEAVEKVTGQRPDTKKRALDEVFPALNEGRLDRARLLLEAIDRRWLRERPEIRQLGRYFDGVGRLHLAEGRWEQAEAALRRATELLERGKASAARRAKAMEMLARGLRDNGRWPEAEPLFREALRLKEEGRDTAANRGITLHELAVGLRDNGRWPEAEPLFREALRLAEDGGDTAVSRGITLHHLAIGLRDNGRPSEAEPLFREALRLAEEGGDTPESRALTHEALADTLDALGRPAEAATERSAAAALRETSKVPG